MPNLLDKKDAFWSDTPSDSLQNEPRAGTMAVQHHPQTFVTFSGYHLDLVNFELKKNGTRIRLPNQPARVLAFLASRPGQIVRRETLQREIWSDDTFVDFEHALNNCVKQIRAVLGDDASNPRYIETIPKRGYRFVGKLESSASQASEASVSAAEQTVPERPLPVSANGNGASGQTALPQNIGSASHSSPGIAALPFTRNAHGLKRLLLALCFAAIALLGWSLLRPPRPPHIIAVQQLTHDGHAEFTSDMVTDGVRLYFTERTGGKWSIAQVSVSGGEPALVPTPFTNNALFDISPDGSHLLVGSFEGDEQQLALWSVPIPEGAPRRLGDTRAQGAAWSPDGQSLMYASDKDIYMAGADGSEPRKIATAMHPPESFRWSPDGRVVRFTQGDGKLGALTLWQIGSDGTDLRTFTPEGNAPADAWLVGECNGGWSADGKYYFYRSQRADGLQLKAIREKQNFVSALLWPSARNAVRVYSREEGGFCGVLPSRDDNRVFFIAMREVRQLVRYDQKLKQYDPYLSGVAGSWANVSFDGKRIAYVSSTDGTLWISAIDGTGRRQLTFPPILVTSPIWSPDAGEIAYQAWLPRKLTAVYVIPADGGQPTELTKGDSYFDGVPRWSPDGDAVLFDRFVPGNKRLGTFSIDRKTRQLSKVDVPENLAWMRWSPNGRYAYAAADSRASTTPQERGGLYLFDRTTNQWKELANAAFLNLVGWTPDSKYIYYQDKYGGEAQPVFRVRVPDGKIERLTAPDFASPVDIVGYTLVGIAPDGAPLASAIRRTADIYSITYKP
ncbi:MAG TPA: winged helix-turn-helix domain-containing protein [Candidatus Acidoferrales bacterium]|nr:winged helix-turn-helix domain-containing protein [Candidatus Acidoferrales bacterium]